MKSEKITMNFIYFLGVSSEKKMTENTHLPSNIASSSNMVDEKTPLGYGCTFVDSLRLAKKSLSMPLQPDVRFRQIPRFKRTVTAINVAQD